MSTGKCYVFTLVEEELVIPTPRSYWSFVRKMLGKDLVRHIFQRTAEFM